MISPMLTTRQVGDRLNLSVYAVRKLIKRGELQAFKVGAKSLRIPQNSLREFLERRDTRRENAC